MLSQLVCDILIILVSTVSLDSTFSTTGRILDNRRTSLTPKMVEVLTCVKEWELLGFPQHKLPRIGHKIDKKGMLHI